MQSKKRRVETVAGGTLDEHLDRIFFALSDRTRRKTLARLSEGESTVSELAEPHEMSLPAILKHLGVLRDAGLVNEEKNGRVRRCRLDPEELKKVNAWIAHYRKFWEAQLDQLETYLEELDKKEAGEKPRRSKGKK